MVRRTSTRNPATSQRMTSRCPHAHVEHANPVAICITRNTRDTSRSRPIQTSNRLRGRMKGRKAAPQRTSYRTPKLESQPREREREEAKGWWKKNAKARHVKRVNSKVSLSYQSTAASNLAHEKIVAEQLVDERCSKIRAALEDCQPGEAAKKPSKAEAERIEKNRKFYFMHDCLLMRRFVPVVQTQVKKKRRVNKGRRANNRTKWWRSRKNPARRSRPSIARRAGRRH